GAHLALPIARAIAADPVDARPARAHGRRTARRPVGDAAAEDERVVLVDVRDRVRPALHLGAYVHAVVEQLADGVAGERLDRARRRTAVGDPVPRRTVDASARHVV